MWVESNGEKGFSKWKAWAWKSTSSGKPVFELGLSMR